MSENTPTPVPQIDPTKALKAIFDYEDVIADAKAKKQQILQQLVAAGLRGPWETKSRGVVRVVVTKNQKGVTKPQLMRQTAKKTALDI